MADVVAAWWSDGRDRAISRGAVSAYGDLYAWGAADGAVVDTSECVRRFDSVKAGMAVAWDAER